MRFAITNATVVLADQVLERATVYVGDGLVTGIGADIVGPSLEMDEVIDAGGAYLLPGIVDLHNDSLEFEVNPRVRANLPLPFALANLERRYAAAGITTGFHAISFAEKPDKERSVTSAAERAAFIAQVDAALLRPVDHQVLHRIDVRNPDALDVIFASLSRLKVCYVSLNDHTPGQGQYRDLRRFLDMNARSMARRGGVSRTQENLEARMAAAAADTETVPDVYRRVREEAVHQPIVIATHDDDTPEKVDAQWEIGATVAEFPVTIEAARRAREHGMTIVIGAPNIIRGGSQSGNLAAADLLDLDLADVICADYHAPSVLAAALRIARDGMRDLPSAIRMVTRNPALAVGLDDRGEIAPGLRADLVLARLDDNGFPHVEATWIAGRRTFAFTCLGANVRVDIKQSVRPVALTTLRSAGQ